MKLHHFFRSGTSHRLRIAMNLKGLKPDLVAVDLRSEEHLQDTFKALNPQQLVPALQLDDGQVLIQSLALIEWLEERYPDPPLLPTQPEQRARVRALAAIVGCDVHPLNNRRILEYLRKTLGQDEAAIHTWCQHWISAGFDALEALLAQDTRRGDFCFGKAPTLADAYLIPQIESSRRFHLDLGPWPLIRAIDLACAALPAFADAAPGRHQS